MIKISNEKQNFWNQKVGGLGLGLTILALYIGFKFVNVDLSYSLFWYSFWFTGIILNALATDLFQNTENWIFNSMYEIERKDIDDKQKFKILKEQLQIAVNRFDTVFYNINGKSGKTVINRIVKGSITVKELIVITLYALYDLVLKGGYLKMVDPYDIMVIFIILVVLKIIDANSGFTQLVTEMYKRAFEEKYTSTTLDTIRGYIRQLCQLFNIDYDKNIIESIS